LALSRLFKRLLVRLLSAASSELVSRGILFAVSAISAAGALPTTSFRTELLAISGAFAVTAGFDAGRRAFLYRREPHSVTDVEMSLEVRDDGRALRYRRLTRIRARKHACREFHTHTHWTGETPLKENIRRIGSGFDIGTTDTRSGVLVKFIFEEPLLRWRKSASFGAEYELTEPERNYSRLLGFTARGTFSPLARLTLRLTWDDTQPVITDSIVLRVFRTPWDKTVGLAAVRVRRGALLKRIANGVEWTTHDIHPDFYYCIFYTLRSDNPRSSESRR
jgi:hypothetical protein